LNLRPPGYEPGELPDCSTPRRGGEYSIDAVLALVLGALVVGFAAAFAGAMVAVREGIRFFRVAGVFGSALDTELTALNAGVSQLERSASELEDSAKLERSLARLASSRARLAVLTSAWSEARAALTRITEFVPRK
jgi:hypothetical protein